MALTYMPQQGTHAQMPAGQNASQASSTQKLAWSRRQQQGARSLYPAMSPSAAPDPVGYAGGSSSMFGPGGRTLLPQGAASTPAAAPEPVGYAGTPSGLPSFGAGGRRMLPQAPGGPAPAGGGLDQPLGSASAPTLTGAQAAAPKLNRVDEALTGPVTVAAQQFQQYAQKLLGRALTDAELGNIASQVGLSGDTITGRQFNQALGILEGMGPGAWQGQPQAEVPTIGGGYSPTPGYTGPQVGYRPPNTSQVDAKSEAILKSLQDNPDLYDQNAINQMKAAGRTTALNRADQLKTNARAGAASRGFANGGFTARADAASESQLINDLLNSDREVDLTATRANRDARMGVLGAGESFSSGRHARDLGTFGAQLQAEQFNQGVRSEDRAAQLKEFLAAHGVDLDRMNFAEAQKQFKVSTGLDLMKFIESQRQFNTTSGLTATSLNMQGQQMLYNYMKSAGLI